MLRSLRRTLLVSYYQREPVCLLWRSLVRNALVVVSIAVIALSFATTARTASACDPSTGVCQPPCNPATGVCPAPCNPATGICGNTPAPQPPPPACVSPEGICQVPCNPNTGICPKPDPSVTPNPPNAPPRRKLPLLGFVSARLHDVPGLNIQGPPDQRSLRRALVLLAT